MANDRTKGLTEKYAVARHDGKPLKDGAIVMEWGDPKARVGIAAFSRAVRAAGYQALADDLDKRLESYGFTHPGITAADSAPDLTALSSEIEDYINGYELRGDDGDYQPNEREVFLMEDMAAGLVEDVLKPLFVATTPQSANDTPCKWHTDGNGCWMGSCGIVWYFEDGGPDENGVNYCPKCGNRRVNDPESDHE